MGHWAARQRMVVTCSNRHIADPQGRTSERLLCCWQQTINLMEISEIEWLLLTRSRYRPMRIRCFKPAILDTLLPCFLLLLCLCHLFHNLALAHEAACLLWYMIFMRHEKHQQHKLDLQLEFKIYSQPCTEVWFYNSHIKWHSIYRTSVLLGHTHYFLNTSYFIFY